MSEMIERVKAALMDNIGAGLGDGGSVDYDYAARAAIEAMRGPTAAMAAAYYAGDRSGSPHIQSPEELWAAMIDAALAETPK